MNMRQLLLAILSLLVGWGTTGVAQGAPTITFEAGDRPGNFFTCSNTANSSSIGCVPGAIGGAQQRSLAGDSKGRNGGVFLGGWRSQHNPYGAELALANGCHT